MIYCVEDDKSICNIELYTLKSAGFEAFGFSCGNDFFEALEDQMPDLILMDIMLPDIDGVEILKKLRGNPKTADIPVVMATAKGTEFDKIQSLDFGADDYLVKPFGMLEMVSRIKAVLRRCKSAEKSGVLCFGMLSVDTGEYRVIDNGNELILTYKEFELLKFFLENVGNVVKRETLYEKIWGEDYIGESRTLDVHIRTLRQKIGRYGDFIKTVRNVGYRMEAYHD